MASNLISQTYQSRVVLRLKRVRDLVQEASSLIENAPWDEDDLIWGDDIGDIREKLSELSGKADDLAEEVGGWSP